MLSARSQNSNSSAAGLSRKASTSTQNVKPEQTSVQFKIGGMATGQCDSIIVTEGEIPLGKTRLYGLARKHSKQQSIPNGMTNQSNPAKTFTQPKTTLKQVVSPRKTTEVSSSIYKKKSSIVKKSLAESKAAKEQIKNKFLVQSSHASQQNCSSRLVKQPNSPTACQIIKEFLTPDNAHYQTTTTDQTTLSRSTSNNQYQQMGGQTKVEVTKYVYDDLDSMMKDKGPINRGVNCQVQSSKAIFVEDKYTRPNSMQQVYPTKFQDTVSHTQVRASKRCSDKSIQAFGLVQECLILVKSAEYQKHDPKLISQLTELKEILQNQMPLDCFGSQIQTTLEQVSADVQIRQKTTFINHKKSATTFCGLEDPFKVSKTSNQGLPPKPQMTRIGSGIFTIPTEPLNPYGVCQQAPNTARTEIYQDVTKWSSLVNTSQDSELPATTPQRSGRRKRSERMSTDRKSCMSQ